MASTSPVPETSISFNATPIGGFVAKVDQVDAFTGKEDGKTHYMARFAVPCVPGSPWPFCRVTCLSSSNFEPGVYEFALVVYDGRKGEGRANLVRKVS